ncbi:MAG TPA: Flp pilus assembly protein CpaB [Acidimicrobiia bacterium]|nr:Flp pilus assembly protein CpaB [Acidimicrobiia bacterium]
MLFRHSPRALALWIGATLAALIATHSASSDLARLHARARDAGREVEVVVAARDLPIGTTVKRADLRVRRHFERRLPPAAVRSPADAAGRVVSTPVLEGSIVTSRHVAPRERSGLDGAVPAGMRAVRIRPGDGLAPPPGAVVDVLVTFDPSVVPEGEAPTVTVVEGAVVLAADEATIDDGPGVVGVVLLVDVEAARRLAYATANGIVTLALAPPEQARPPRSRIRVRPAGDRPRGDPGPDRVSPHLL